jgi:hypothetical protein
MLNGYVRDVYGGVRCVGSTPQSDLALEASSEQLVNAGFAHALTLPAGHRDVIRDIRFLALPLEFAAIGLIVLAARRAQHRLAASNADNADIDVPVQLRPITVSASELRVRNGLRWSIDIPRAAIDTITFGRVGVPTKGTPGYICATPGQPNVLIALHSAVHARGPYGASREVTRVALVIDDLDSFRMTVS